MTVNDIVALVDLKEPNSYTAAEKIKWLSDLDGKIFNEVILTHEHDDVEFTPYNIHALDPVPEGQTPPEPETLLIGDPYGEDIYVHYLIARIAAGNAETPRYNQQPTRNGGTSTIPRPYRSTRDADLSFKEVRSCPFSRNLNSSIRSSL